MPPGEIFFLLEPLGLRPGPAAGDTTGSKGSASCSVPSSRSSQERLCQCPGLMNSLSTPPRAQRAASYRNAAASLVQAVQGQLQVSCCPGNATGAGHVQEFSYCKHKRKPPKVRLEPRRGKACHPRQKESTGAKVISLESMKSTAKTGAAEAKAHTVLLALPCKQLL